MAGEARLARRLGLADAQTLERQERLLDVLGLPIRMRPLDPGAVLTAMRRDKKGRDGRLPFVLAPSIGSFRIVHDVTEDDVRAVLAEITAS